MSGLTGNQNKIGMGHGACALSARHRSLRRVSVTADKIPLLAPLFSCVFLHPVRSSQETGASARGRVLKVALNFLESRARGVSVFVLTRRAHSAFRSHEKMWALCVMKPDYNHLKVKYFPISKQIIEENYRTNHLHTPNY